jgi:hypothetical protein
MGWGRARAYRRRKCGWARRHAECGASLTDTCRLEVGENATRSCVNGQFCSCGHPRKCGHVQEIRHDHTRPHSFSLSRGERNRSTPAVRLKGHSAKLPSGLLADTAPARRERPRDRHATEQRDDLPPPHVSSFTFRRRGDVSRPARPRAVGCHIVSSVAAALCGRRL